VRTRIVWITVLTVFVVLGSAAVVRNAVLRLFGCSLDGLRVGGGIALLLIGLAKLSGSPDHRGLVGTAGTASRAEIGVVPLGIPLLAGPGAIGVRSVWIRFAEAQGLGSSEPERHAEAF
jgi:multiple antibiotic resistance protein